VASAASIVDAASSQSGREVVCRLLRLNGERASVRPTRDDRRPNLRRLLRGLQLHLCGSDPQSNFTALDWVASAGPGVLWGRARVHCANKRQSKPRFLAWAAQVGPQTTTQVEAIFAGKDHEEQAFRAMRGVQGLARQYGQTRLEAACHRANLFGLVGLRRLRSILQSHLETDLNPAASLNSTIGQHDNLRGQQYYR